MKYKRVIQNYFYNTLYQILILIVPLVTTPYVSRVLGVTKIGIYQYSQSIATYFVLVGAVGTTLYGQREIAYLQDKPRERSIAFWEIEIFRLAATAICTVSFFFLFCLKGPYWKIYRILILEVVATAIDISWLFMGLENFKLIVLRNTIIKMSGVVCVFLFVKKPSDIDIYTACMTCPIFLGNLSLWLSLKKYLVKTGLTLNTLIMGIKKRVTPILLLFFPQIAQEVYLVLDKTMIGLLGTSIDQVGYYSQAQKIVKVVLSIVTSLGIVMLPAMSAFYAKEDYECIKNSIKKAFQLIYMLSFALLFGLCAIAPRFVPIFFGNGYEPVTSLIIIISPILVIIATSNVIGKQYLLPTNQQKAFTLSILAGAGTNFVLNLLFIPSFDAIGASIATVVGEVVVTMVQWWHVRVQLPLKESMISGTRYMVFGAVMFFIVRGIGLLLPVGKVWALGIMIITGIIVYVGELYIMRDPLVEMGFELIKNNRQ